jgi:fumarylacetoacetate (FAA) hydrolase
MDDSIHTLPYPDMLAVIAAGAENAARRASREALSFEEISFLSPLKPTTLRDGYAFEKHVVTANKNRGREVPEEWYQFPVFYFTNPNAVFGHEDVIPYPPYTDAMDFELEIAAVIGKPGINIKPEEAENYIFGYTIFNDWSARDIQGREMKVKLGPAKGKDFATSLGPIVVTPDEFDGSAAEMVARVNGEERSRGDLRDLHWPWARLLEQARMNTRLCAGDVIGSGTVGTGCILEHGDGRWLRPGDVVELEVEGIGILRNTVGTPPRSRE